MKKRVFWALILMAGGALVLFGSLAAVFMRLNSWQLVLLVIFLVLSGGVSTQAAQAIASRTASKLSDPLRTVERAVHRLSAGEGLGEGWDEPLPPEYDSLVRAFEKLQTKIGVLTADRDKVSLILDCMDEGVVLLDERAEILVSNRAARKLFHLPDDDENVELTAYIRSRRLKEALAELQRSRKSVVLDMEHPKRKGRSLRFFLTPVARQEYEGQPVGTSILISDVTELRRAEGIRSEFTANVSHELKTPLTSIKGFTDILSSGMTVSPEDQQRFLTMISVEVDRLIDLINDILKISELESVAIAQCEERSDVQAAASEVAAFLAPVAEKARVTLSVEGGREGALIPYGRLKELLLNLMENGVKYNEPGGSVTASVGAEEEFVKITVSDTGIGIPEESRSRVFERFYRVEKGRARKNGGTGLGLAIVKHIAVLYGGRVTLESEPGKGSIFTVWLPRAELEADAS